MQSRYNKQKPTYPIVDKLAFIKSFAIFTKSKTMKNWIKRITIGILSIILVGFLILLN